jgi:hypothetical protein
MHGGVMEARAIETKSANMYRLAKFGSRVSELASNTQVKGLREEIGILRMMLEERLNMCKDSEEMLLYAGPISELVIKIEKVVGTCHRLEESMGQLLDKQQIIQFAEGVIKSISEEITDPQLLARLAAKIGGQVEQAVAPPVKLDG